MAGIRTLICTFVGMTFTLLAASPAQADYLVRDSQHHCSYKVPEGWGRVASTKLRATIQAVVHMGRLGRNAKFEHIFQPVNQITGTMPFIVVEWFEEPNCNKFTYEEIDEDFQAALEIHRMRLEAGTHEGAIIDRAYLDRQKNAYIIEGRCMIGFDAAAMYCELRIGSEGALAFLSFAPIQTGEKWKPTFDTIFNSVQYEPGFEYVPAQPRMRSFLDRLLSGTEGLKINYAALGAFVLVVGFLVYIVKKSV
jgi:hypothetical protein